MEPQKENNTLLKITLFAAFQVWLNGRSLTEFATDKARALLAYLMVERQQPHRREKLAALLWPDQPTPRARQSLRQALTHLRQALGDDEDTTIPFLLINRNEIQFNPQAQSWLDVAEFITLADTCNRHHHHHPTACLPCLHRMEAMLALYTDDFLAGFSVTDSILFEEWVLLKREWLHIQAVEALVHVADFYERRGDYVTARRYAQQLVNLEPWREESHRQLMRLLAHEGQRSAALAQYETCRRALQHEFGISPTVETVNLHTAIREARNLSQLAPYHIAATLPTAATPFVGRVMECAELAEMLADPDSRLISLIGTGGTGKTRLAMQVAAAQVGLFADGVVWVELTAVHNSHLIIPTLAQAVGFVLVGKEPPETQLLAYLREKRMLIILDNAEHLPAIAQVVATVLQHAPQINLLITSRERLALREEWLYTVEGLASTAEAVQLFKQTVRQSNHKFKPTAVDEAAISEICQLVEGLPLALELAAAWVPERGCAAVAQSLVQDMALLTTSLRNMPERQRSVQATFEYSWQQLSGEDRLFFARLAVFRGGFTEDAAAQIAGVDKMVLTRLVAKSLVRHEEGVVAKPSRSPCTEPSRSNRYQLHELLRQFARHKLADFTDEAANLAADHAAYYLAFLAEQETALKGTGQEAALAALDQEIANVRHAWEWAVEALEDRSADTAVWVANALESLYLFYGLHSWYLEGAAVFERAATSTMLRDPTATTLSNQLQRLRGELLARQARCLEFTAPPEQAITLYQESLACFRAVHAERETALPLYGLGYMAHIQGDYDASHRYFRQSYTQYQEAGDRWGMANVQSSLCLTLRRQGDFAKATVAGRKSLVIRREIGDRRGIASSQNNLGLIYCAVGDFGAAEEALQESVAICRDMGHTVGVANALTSLCQLFANAKAYDQARAVQREAQALYQQVGDLWGVAIAYNNLGQIAIEEGKFEPAQLLLQEAMQIYRELGIQSSLAHALSNLGETSYELGETAMAGQYFHEALLMAVEIGDRPMALELLIHIAVLTATKTGNGRSLIILAFTLQQPELVAETRKTAVAQFTILKNKFSAEAVASAEKEARHLDFDTVTREALTLVQQFLLRDGNCTP